VYLVKCHRNSPGIGAAATFLTPESGGVSLLVGVGASIVADFAFGDEIGTSGQAMYDSMKAKMTSPAENVRPLDPSLWCGMGRGPC
jgi:hypothetical protein